MKSLFTCIILAINLYDFIGSEEKTKKRPFIPPVQNLFIISIDGFRWQEVFTGADSALINNEDISRIQLP